MQAAPAEFAPRHRKQVIRNYYILPFSQIIYLGKLQILVLQVSSSKLPREKNILSCSKIKHTEISLVLLQFSNFVLSCPFD